MSDLTRAVPCSIKGCVRLAKIDTQWPLEPLDFVLCEQCENAVLIDNLAYMERLGRLPAHTAKNFAVVWNHWKLQQKGEAIPHRPINLAFHRPLVPPLENGH